MFPSNSSGQTQGVLLTIFHARQNNTKHVKKCKYSVWNDNKIQIQKMSIKILAIGVNDLHCNSCDHIIIKTVKKNKDKEKKTLSWKDGSVLLSTLI